MRYEIELLERTTPLFAEESVTAPLPVFGLLVDYSISNSWNIIFDFKAFSLELDDETRGAMDELQLTLEYRLLKNVFIGGGINLRNVNLKLEDDDARWNVSGLSRGAQAYAGLRF